MHLELWLYLVGIGLIAAGIQFVLFFLAFPSILRKTTPKNWNLKYLPFMIAGLSTFLAQIFSSLSLFDYPHVSDVARNDRAAYILGPLLASGIVMIWGLIRCVKMRESYKEGEWKKAKTDSEIARSASQHGNSEKTSCVDCLEPMARNANICENCGFPFSQTSPPRTVKFRWSKTVWVGLVTMVLYLALINYRAKALFPLAWTKYFGSPATAKIIAVHCDFSDAVKDSSWLEVEYSTPSSAKVLGKTGSKRSGCSNTLVGQLLPIQYRDGEHIVTRDDGNDIVNVPLFTGLLVLGNLLFPLLLTYAFFNSKKLARNGKLHKAKVCPKFYERSVDVEYEEHGRSHVRSVTFWKERPQIGSSFWIMENGSKGAARISDDYFPWKVLPSGPEHHLDRRRPGT